LKRPSSKTTPRFKGSEVISNYYNRNQLVIMHPCKQVLLSIVLSFSFFTLSYGQETPWQNIGPYMGYINSMAMDRAHPDTLYAATPYGIYKSTDCAENWIKTTLSGLEINALEISPSNPEILIAFTDSVIYKSENGGDSWTEIWKSDRDIGAIAFDPDDPLGIWAGVDVSEWQVYEENLYYSDDGGTSWNPVAFEAGEELKLATVLDIHFDRSNSDVMYVSGWGDTYHVDGGLFVSQDRGTSWTNFRPGGCSSNTVVALASTPAGYEPHAVYALVGPDCGVDKEMHRSLDYGSTWEEFWAPFDADEQRWAGKVLDFDLDDPEWLLVSGKDNEKDISVFLYNTVSDGWYAWTNSPHAFPTAILSHPDGNFLGFNDKGIYQNYYTEETGNLWNAKYQGMNDVEIYDIISYPGDAEKILTATAGNLAETGDGGDHWSVTSSSYVRLAINEQDTSMLYAGKRVSSHTFMSPFYCYKTENGGDSWLSKQMFTNSGMLDAYYTLWVGDILISPDNPDDILVGVDGGGGCGEGLYRSTDGGDSWDREHSTGVSCLAMDPSDPEIVYLGTSGLGYVNRSANGGASWDLISPGGNDAFVSSVRNLAVDNKQDVYAATSAGLYRWDDGTAWTRVQGVPEINIPALLIDNRSATSVFYAGTEGQGVFISKNGGTTWESFNSGLTPMHITRLKMDDATPARLLAGTIDGGVWITELEVAVSAHPRTMGPPAELQIYPNPSDGIFNVRLPGDADLKGSLQITNLLGKTIFMDHHFEIPANGSRSISLTEAGPGCYLLMFRNKEHSITRKIVVEKR